jgi:Domain of unknown function (DUF4421)
MIPGKMKRRPILVGNFKNLVSILISCFLFSGIRSQGVKTRDHDSTYYESFRDKLTVRAFFSRKYNIITLNPPEDEKVPAMTYRPNSLVAVGLGGSYRSFTINIGVGVTPLHPVEERGKTHYFDLQSHLYTRKWNLDFLGQFYRGYYLSPQGLGSADGKSYYIRNDLALQMGGIGCYRAINDRKFSYQAGMVQNEWQKKSAGSLLVGGEAFYGAIHGDSTLVPTLLDPSYSQKGIRQVHFFEFGPGIGYAYTLVFWEHFFLLASATVNLDFRFTRELESGQNADRTDFTPNFIFHAGIGYSTRKWNLSVKWVGNRIFVKGNGTGYQYVISPGNYRLIYARHFTLNRRVKKALQPLDDILAPN